MYVHGDDTVVDDVWTKYETLSEVVEPQPISTEKKTILLGSLGLDFF